MVTPTVEQARTEYRYRGAEAPWLESCLWPMLRSILQSEYTGPKRLFELGCGNGATANMLSEMGFDVVGVDPSVSGIETANTAYPQLALRVGSAYDDLASTYGRFPLVVSLEVIEHCFYPRKFARCVFDLLEDGGVAIVSTPFHGYWKNLAISILGKWDQHLNPLWDHGHIKFFSERTLRALMRQAGFTVQRIHRAGRVPPFAKSMVAVLGRPGTGSSPPRAD